MPRLPLPYVSSFPSLGEYIPSAPINDEARKQNENLPGMSGVFNAVNLQLYHYVDPDGRTFWDVVQGALDVVGCIPVIGEVADDANALISLGRGDYLGAALSAASMIPIVGDALGKGGKAVRYAAKYGDEVASLAKTAVKRADTVVDTARAAGNGANPASKWHKATFDTVDDSIA